MVLLTTQNNIENFCSVGDVLQARNLDTSGYMNILLKGMKDNVLKPPKDFEEVWNAEGTGANSAAMIFRMIPYPGYTCLGNAILGVNEDLQCEVMSADRVQCNNHDTTAQQCRGAGCCYDNTVSGHACFRPRSYSSTTNRKPKASDYCCVKTDYVVKGRYTFAWDSIATGGKQKAAMWNVDRAFGDARGLLTGNFISRNYGTNAETVQRDSNGNFQTPNIELPVLLNTEDAKIQAYKQDKTIAQTGIINLYEVNDMDEIWRDTQSGASMPLSFWKPKTRPGFYIVSHTGHRSYGNPGVGVILKSSDKEETNTFRNPLSYNKLWEAQFGVNPKVTVWSLNCPAGYVALGTAVTTGGELPEFGSIYCIHHKYTVQGTQNDWATIWTHVAKQSGFPYAFRKAKCYVTIRGSGRRSLSAITFQSTVHVENLPSSPYFLDGSKIFTISEKPISKMTMKNIKFDLNSVTKTAKPVELSPTFLINYSHIPQTTTRTITYTDEKSSSFSFGVEMSIGISFEAEVSIPLIGSTGVSFSASASVSYSTGEEKTETQVDSIEASIEVPDISKIRAAVVANRYTTKMSYTAELTKIYYDGEESTELIQGVYDGVNINEVQVQYGSIIALGTEEIEGQVDEVTTKDEAEDSDAEDTELPAADIVYKIVDASEFIWQCDKCQTVISFWRPVILQPGFCSLGDIANVASMSAPMIHVLVKAVKKGALVNPQSLTKVWDDEGADNAKALSVWYMEPPLGYTCLGSAISGLKGYTPPDPKRYCCVKNEYLVDAKFRFGWRNTGSRADDFLDVYHIERADGDSFGIHAGTFYAGTKLVRVNSYNSKIPDLAPKLLKHDDVKVRIEGDQKKINNNDAKISVYEVTEMNQIWNTAGHGSSNSLSVWRPPINVGFYHVADIATDKSDQKPGIGYLIKSSDPDAFRLPDSYQLVWSTKYTPIKNHVSMWTLNCPPGYVALGSIAMPGLFEPPTACQ